MAIYKIKPKQDSTIYPGVPNMNTGLDEILEIIPSGQGSSRILLQFSDEDLEESIKVLSGSIENEDYEIELKLYKAYIENLHKDTEVELYPITGSWDMGTGRSEDNPYNPLGVTWEYKEYIEGGEWNNKGGDYIEEYKKTFKIGYYSDLDLKFDVTNIIDKWWEGLIPNDGFLLKLSNTNEIHSGVTLKYYSKDTHSIYSPKLIFKWVDYQYEENEENLIQSSDIIMSILTQPSYNKKSIPIFKINLAERYPQRIFTTSYLYNKKHLPLDSWYALKDTQTGEYTIPFDDKYTRLSSNGEYSYFKMYLNQLDLERNYTICIKTIIEGVTIIWEDKSAFKIIN